jgi:hypothetical protein
MKDSTIHLLVESDAIYEVDIPVSLVKSRRLRATYLTRTTLLSKA